MIKTKDFSEKFIKEISEYFSFDFINGKIYKKNKEMGTISTFGYIQISYKKKLYLAHRLLWAVKYNKNPKQFIDHINGIKTDNRIENLRDVCHRQNHGNRRNHRDGSLVGASYCKSRGDWVSALKINGIVKSLGRFKTQKEAHLAYLKKINTMGVDL